MSKADVRARAPRRQLPAVLQFMQRLWALAHGLDRTSKQMTRVLGVTGPQRLVLRVVALFPGLSAGEVAAVLHLHPSTLTGVLRRLVTTRLLVRSRDPQDYRRAQLRLTTRGHQANAAAEGTAEAAVGRALKRTSHRDRLAAQRVLDELIEQLTRTPRPATARHRGRSSSRSR